MTDLARYAACEMQKIEDEPMRLVRLHPEPMPAREVLSWLVENGYVKREPTDDPDGNGWKHVGWGTTYCAAPFDRTVER